MRNYLKLSPLAMGLSLGTLWSLTFLSLCLLNLYIGYGTAIITAISGLYIGFSLSLTGILIGMAWAFLDAFIGGFIIAFIYNIFVK